MPTSSATWRAPPARPVLPLPSILRPHRSDSSYLTPHCANNHTACSIVSSESLTSNKETVARPLNATPFLTDLTGAVTSQLVQSQLANLLIELSAVSSDASSETVSSDVNSNHNSAKLPPRLGKGSNSAFEESSTSLEPSCQKRENTSGDDASDVDKSSPESTVKHGSDRRPTMEEERAVLMSLLHSTRSILHRMDTNAIARQQSSCKTPDQNLTEAYKQAIANLSSNRAASMEPLSAIAESVVRAIAAGRTPQNDASEGVTIPRELALFSTGECDDPTNTGTTLSQPQMDSIIDAVAHTLHVSPKLVMQACYGGGEFIDQSSTKMHGLQFEKSGKSNDVSQDIYAEHKDDPSSTSFARRASVTLPGTQDSNAALLVSSQNSMSSRMGQSICARDTFDAFMDDIRASPENLAPNALRHVASRYSTSSNLDNKQLLSYNNSHTQPQSPTQINSASAPITLSHDIKGNQTQLSGRWLQQFRENHASDFESVNTNKYQTTVNSTPPRPSHGTSSFARTAIFTTTVGSMALGSRNSPLNDSVVDTTVPFDSDTVVLSTSSPNAFHPGVMLGTMSPPRRRAMAKVTSSQDSPDSNGELNVGTYNRRIPTASSANSMTNAQVYAMTSNPESSSSMNQFTSTIAPMFDNDMTTKANEQVALRALISPPTSAPRVSRRQQILSSDHLQKEHSHPHISESTTTMLGQHTTAGEPSGHIDHSLKHSSNAESSNLYPPRNPGKSFNSDKYGSYSSIRGSNHSLATAAASTAFMSPDDRRRYSVEHRNSVVSPSILMAADDLRKVQSRTPHGLTPTIPSGGTNTSASPRWESSYQRASPQKHPGVFHGQHGQQQHYDGGHHHHQLQHYENTNDSMPGWFPRIHSDRKEYNDPDAYTGHSRRDRYQYSGHTNRRSSRRRLIHDRGTVQLSKFDHASLVESDTGLRMQQQRSDSDITQGDDATWYPRPVSSRQNRKRSSVSGLRLRVRLHSSYNNDEDDDLDHDSTDLEDDGMSSAASIGGGVKNKRRRATSISSNSTRGRGRGQRTSITNKNREGTVNMAGTAKKRRVGTRSSNTSSTRSTRTTSRGARTYNRVSSSSDQETYDEDTNADTTFTSSMTTTSQKETSSSNTSAPRRVSKFLGVSWIRATEKWRADSVVNGKLQYLGCYDTEVEAAQAVDGARVAGWDGHSKLRLNFPQEHPQVTTATAAVKQARGTSTFVGVSWDTKLRKWKARIVLDGRHERIGLFDSEESAARAVDKSKVQHWNGTTMPRLNFPEEYSLPYGKGSQSVMLRTGGNRARGKGKSSGSGNVLQEQDEPYTDSRVDTSSYSDSLDA